ncbi:MAG: TonB-dependent receptor [Desulfobacterales bacterium]|nr:TonB-dependent receptor [Desulfobacterales bacterium]
MPGKIRHRLMLLSWAAAYLFFPAPLPAAGPAADAVLAEDQFLELYFDKDQLVQAPTRSPKPLSQVAENVTIIYADEIEAMNAHNLAEVLNRVTGLYISSNGRDFGSSASLTAQGSEPRHVLVLLDGIVWNYIGSGRAGTSQIPLGIIKRVEVIKGPASSTWGAALGGVINIITRDAGTSARPVSTLSLSYGQARSLDVQARVAGRAGTVGYLLHAGRQRSDGLLKSREFFSSSLYGKFTLDPQPDHNLTLTLGYSDPEWYAGDLPSGGILSQGLHQRRFVTATLDSRISPVLALNLSLHAIQRRFDQLSDESGLYAVFGPGYQRGDLFENNIFDETNYGAGGRLVWTPDSHTVVLGLDLERNENEQRNQAGAYRQWQGAAPFSTYSSEINQWAIYGNDTLARGRLTLTPGIRLDGNSITKPFISPSLGITYRLRRDTLLRGQVARAFTIPPLSWLSGGGLFFDPNPDLEPEQVWSFQAGIESTAVKYLWLKGTVFRHDLDNTFGETTSPLNPKHSTMQNMGKEHRTGFEAEAKSAPFHNLTLGAGFSLASIDRDWNSDDQTLYSSNLELAFTEPKTGFKASLFGHFVWWDLPDSTTRGSYDDFIWDLNASKKILTRDRSITTLFVTVHNLFNGTQYRHINFKDPDRWVEGGIRVFWE